jgi:NAD(P)-dependent dehydrogenase (short-subunit alcohol dehydrogenase family)
LKAIRIGFGVAEAVTSLDAKVAIISSSEEKVSNALSRLSNSFPEQQNNVQGHTVDVTDTDKFVAILRKLAPIDHLIYSAVDSPVRKDLAELDLVHVKHTFDIKFWGAANSGIGEPDQRIHD